MRYPKLRRTGRMWSFRVYELAGRLLRKAACGSKMENPSVPNAFLILNFHLKNVYFCVNSSAVGPGRATGLFRRDINPYGHAFCSYR